MLEEGGGEGGRVGYNEGGGGVISRSRGVGRGEGV